jgi:hypothetical protein
MPTAHPCQPGLDCCDLTASPTVTANPAASSSTHLAGALWVQAKVDEHMRGSSEEGAGSGGVRMGTAQLYMFPGLLLTRVAPDGLTHGRQDCCMIQLYANETWRMQGLSSIYADGVL